MLEGKSLAEAIAMFNLHWAAHKNQPVWYSLGDFYYDAIDLPESELRAIRKINEMDERILEAGWLSVKAKGELMIAAYEKEIMPLFKRVISVQNEVKLTNDSGQSLIGFADIIVETHQWGNVLFDNKTTSVRYSENSVGESAQLATYYALLKDKYDLNKAGFITIDKAIRKKDPKVNIKVLVGDISPELIQNTFDSYDVVLSKILDGNFERDYTGCTTKFGPCDYYNFCHNQDSTGLKEEL